MGIISLIVSCLTLAIYHFAGGGNSVTIKETQAVPVPTKSVIQEDMKVFPTAVGGSNVDFRQAAEQALNAVVHIKSIQTYTSRRRSVYEQLFGLSRPNNRQNVATGSGVIISPEGHIVTNNHVIEGADELEVTLYDNRTFPATVIGTDPTTDLGLIRIDDPNLTFINFADSDEAMVGQWVLAVGNPFSLTSTATAGIISAIGRDLQIIEDQDQMAIESFIQTDAAVNPGNSGGALVDLNGNLLGINTAIASPTGTYAGYAFAVPSNIVRKVVEDLVEYGKVQRAFLGVKNYINLDSETAKQLDLNKAEGVVLLELNDNGGAAKAGVKARDVVIAVDGNPVKTSAKMLEMIARKRPGEDVRISVLRDGIRKEFTVILTDQLGRTEVNSTMRSDVLNELGLVLEDVSSYDLSRYGAEYGVLVFRLNAGIVKRDTDMRAGFVIMEANGQKVTNAEDLTKALESINGQIKVTGFYPGGRYIQEFTFSR